MSGESKNESTPSSIKSSWTSTNLYFRHIIDSTLRASSSCIAADSNVTCKDTLTSQPKAKNSNTSGKTTAARNAGRHITPSPCSESSKPAAGDYKSANGPTTSSGDCSTAPSPASVPKRMDTETLQDKLKARIAELQMKRRGGLTAEEFLESKKLRRKESKLKHKLKRKEQKKKMSIAKQSKNNQQKLNGVSEVEPSLENGKANSGSNIVFSKFEFSDQAKKPKDRKQKKPKSYKELYDKVTKSKEKLEELKETDPEKAKRVAEKTAWRKAMDQSKGIKVKDNPELIKKSMKKEEKLKQRSKKKWEERTNSVLQQQQKRQEKRKKNIQAKKQSNVDRKIKLAKKKGRMVSGF